MTDSPTADVAGTSSPATIKPIAELFRGEVVAMWATTFNLDLALFNEYLLRRLGDPPLNVVVLADQERVDAALAAIPPEQLASLGPVNRRWLLRGMRMGTGRFHPKSYLAVTARTARLLVGSGNLSTNGIDAGREVFTSFAAGTPVGDAAIGTWLDWMRRLVIAADDTALAERFTDLESRLPTSTGPAPVVPSPVWHNLDAPLGNRFCDTVLGATQRVDELIVTAPYFDETGAAIGTLADRLRPKHIRLYTTSTTNVDGAQLAARLAATDATVEVAGYVPDRFTHAKLVAAVTADRGWLLSGSANLSNAALRHPAGPGNVELAVIAELSAEQAASTFLPPEVAAEPQPLSVLAELRFDSGDEDAPEPSPVRLLNARLLKDGRVEAVTLPPADPAWRLANHDTIAPVSVTGSTATSTVPLDGPLIHVADADGVVLSNRVVVDDPDALRRILQVGDRTGTGRPAELNSTDLDTPLGRALAHLHQHAVMDVSEQAGTGGGGDVTRDEVDGGDVDDSLWDRLERDKLGRDPRAGTYGRLSARAGERGGAAEPLVELLDAMRHRAPGDSVGDGRALLRLITDAGDEPGTRPGTRWSTTAKIRVRARNVLRRWAAAQTDPRLVWVDSLAPAGNVALVAAMFAELWVAQATPDAVAELTADDLDDLWARWFWPFVGTGQGDGWLDRVDGDDEKLKAVLAGDFTRNVTALCCLAIRPGGSRRERLVAWQPYLRAAFDRDLIDVDDDVIALLTAAGHPADHVVEDLLEALEFIDDALWCERTAAEFGLDYLALEAMAQGQTVSVRLDVGGVTTPLHDPRLPSLVVAVSRYRKTDAVAVYAADAEWRLVVSGGEPVMYLADLDAATRESAPTSPHDVASLAASNGVFADLLPADTQVA